MTYILGISAFYHDSAAALVATARSSRPCRRSGSPARSTTRGSRRESVHYCLDEAGISPEQLDYVAFYEQPLTKFERLFETYIVVRAGRVRQLPPGACRSGCGRSCTCPARSAGAWAAGTPARSSSPSHHESHAASAFFPSPVRGGRDPDAGRRRRVVHHRGRPRHGQPRSS